MTDNGEAARRKAQAEADAERKRIENEAASAARRKMQEEGWNVGG